MALVLVVVKLVDIPNQWMMLAAGSTIAGNLTILAAASNIIILEAAESKDLKTFSFFRIFQNWSDNNDSNDYNLLYIYSYDNSLNIYLS